MVMQYRIEDKDDFILDIEFRSRFVFMQDIYTRNNPKVKWTGSDEQFGIVLKMINDAIKLFEPAVDEDGDDAGFRPVYDMDGNLLRY